MARALTQILAELDNVYNPQRDVYNSQLADLDPQQKVEQKGLDAAKNDAFEQITNQANRRGLLYSGIPIAEEQKYTGASYLPAVANLKSRYVQQKFNIQAALAKLLQDEYSQAYGIRQGEMEAEAAAAAARSSRGGGVPSFGGFGGGGGGEDQAAPNEGLTLRQQWQREANLGDWDAQVALNYAGDNGRYDGPVNTLDEYNRLKNMGIKGNYYYRKAGGGGGGGGGGGF